MGTMPGISTNQKRCCKKLMERIFCKSKDEIAPLLEQDKATQEDVKFHVATSTNGHKMLEVCRCEHDAKITVGVSHRHNDVWYQVQSIVENALNEEETTLTETVETAIGAIQWGENNCPSKMPSSLHQQFIQLVEKIVTANFLQFPSQETESIEAYLAVLQNSILKELMSTGNCSNPALMLETYAKCFDKCIFSQLHKALERNLQANDLFMLLFWVANTYKSEQLMGHPAIKDHSLKNLDSVLCSSWIEKARKILLNTIQIKAEGRLENILQNEFQSLVSSPVNGNDEEFIKLYVDTIQVLNSSITEAKRISDSLTSEVETICCQQLLSFIQKYQGHVKKLTCSKTKKICEEHQFRIVNNCCHLREYVEKIAEDKTDDSYKIAIRSLEETESQATKLLLQGPVHKLKFDFKDYFKKEGKSIEETINDITELFRRALPMKKQMAYKIVVDKAYQQTCLKYFNALLNSVYNRLLKKWGNVEHRIYQDANILHRTFENLSPGVENHVGLICRVNDILKTKDPEALKLDAAVYFSNNPEISVQQLSALLKWRGDIPSSEIRSILDMCSKVVANNEVNQTVAVRMPLWLPFCCCAEED
ncbi:exocyst complex component 3-like [Acipenser ruthenus]|uniref:exocyst complex component 3-like n=1 Tax=Acipenser ruthenus TaxID=7906 RepID=UPI0027403DC1|nr:exocyst complex component 3-like [Acipenser ruthenus]